MGVAASLPRRTARQKARLSVLARLGALHALVFVVCASFVVRTVAGFGKATPIYYPDEYMYAELGRSLAESGRPLVRGAEASFPALLQPLLTAPAWALGDVATGYRLIQVLGALAMSLAAVPVFFLGVRLGIGRKMALGSAALAVVLPSLMYASWVLAEPFAYPLLLAATYAGTVALADRSRRAGLAFVFLAALAAFTRAQFAVLPVCFFLSVLVLGLRGRSLRPELRAQALPLILFAGSLALLLAFLGRALGMYGAFLDLQLDPARLAQDLGTNAMGLMYASGWILVPGACLGIVLALTRARTREELAFGALTLGLIAALLLQASLYGDPDRVEERYTFYAAPLLALAFGLFASRGWPWKRAHALLAAAALLLSMLVPLSGYAAGLGKIQSPFLFATAQLELSLGEAGAASLVVAIAVAVLSAGAVGASLRPRVGTPLAMGLALGFCAAASAAATMFDVDNSKGVRREFLPAERSWIDEAGLEDVSLLQGYGLRTEAGAQLFWNRSLDDVVLLPGTQASDSFAASPARIGPDGAILVRGKPLQKPLVVDEWGALTALRGARLVASAPSYRLWRPAGTPRFAFRFAGYFRDGWMAPRGQVSLWPATAGRRVEGTVTFIVTAPEDLDGPAALRFAAPGGKTLELSLAPGVSRRVELPACSQGQWHAAFQIDRSAYDGGRFISLRSTPPRFRPDSTVCK